jgi:CHAT domain-containing protein
VITAHSGAPRFVDLGPAENVNAVVLAWLSNLGVTSDAAWNSLRQTVWEPIRQMLAPAIRRVRVSPDGELVRIPWHQMELNEGERLMEVAEVDSARSLVYLRAQTSRGKVAKLLVVGGLDYDAGRTKESPGVPGSPFKQLTWAEPESEAVVDLGRRNGFSPALLTREKAGKAAVLAGLGDAAYVHFATHGFANGEPERGLSGRSWSVGTRPHFARDPLIDSGLALSGANVRDRNTLVTEGVLSAEDLLDSDLSRSWMVVLSACDTGLGLTTPTQGVMGLRSALSAAGATKLLVSLWSVDDEATKILMTEFYTDLWVQKLPLVEALHAAQGKVRDDARFRAPRFWAGWVVIDAD